MPTSNQKHKTKSPAPSVGAKGSTTATAQGAARGQQTKAVSSSTAATIKSLNFAGLKAKIGLLPDGGPKGREEYIDYALEMVVHNLITSGKIQATQAHLMKSPEMKEHIGRIVDQLRKEKNKAEVTAKTEATTAQEKVTDKPRPAAKLRWAIQPQSLPISIITDKQPPGMKQSNKPKPSKTTGTATVGEKAKISSASLAKTPKKGQPDASGKETSLSKAAKSLTFNNAIKFNKVPLSLSASQTSARAPSTASQTTYGDERFEISSSVDDSLQISEASSPTLSKTPSTSRTSKKFEGGGDKIRKAFKAKLDMRGFKNAEISLDLDGTRLTITGIRQKRDRVNARKTTESVVIPGGVNVDDLKVYRRADGVLVIEESLVPIINAPVIPKNPRPINNSVTKTPSAVPKTLEVAKIPSAVLNTLEDAPTTLVAVPKTSTTVTEADPTATDLTAELQENESATSQVALGVNSRILY